MKNTRRTEKQIASGTCMEEVCRERGISEATFYNRKKKFNGMGVKELRRLEDKNQRFRRLVADLSLEKEM